MAGQWEVPYRLGGEKLLLPNIAGAEGLPINVSVHRLCTPRTTPANVQNKVVSVATPHRVTVMSVLLLAMGCGLANEAAATVFSSKTSNVAGSDCSGQANELEESVILKNPQGPYSGTVLTVLPAGSP
jgi:hypothetical protein